MPLDIDSGCKTHLRGQQNTIPVALPPSGHFWSSDSPLKIDRFIRFWQKMRFLAGGQGKFTPGHHHWFVKGGSPSFVFFSRAFFGVPPKAAENIGTCFCRMVAYGTNPGLCCHPYAKHMSRILRGYLGPNKKKPVPNNKNTGQKKKTHTKNRNPRSKNKTQPKK